MSFALSRGCDTYRLAQPATTINSSTDRCWFVATIHTKDLYLMITPKGYPPLSNLKSRAIWARQQRGWSMIEAMDKYNAGNSPEKQVSWLVLRQIERGQQDSTDEHLLEGLA